MAGFVAEPLAKWEYWDAVAEYGALLTSTVRLDPASRQTIVTYLERCPRPEAKAVLASLPGPGTAVGSLAPGGQQQFQLPDVKVVR